MLSHTSHKSAGISFDPWYGIFEGLLTEHKMPKPKDMQLVQRLYHEDFTALEAIHHLRILTIKSGLLTIRWHDAFGSESVLLSNNEAIRHFYKQNPKLKKAMELEDKYNNSSKRR